jgi:hypothetical protein
MNHERSSAVSDSIVLLKPAPTSIERLGQSALQRFYRLKTRLIRAIGRRPPEEEQLRRRVLARVKELGQWYEDGNSDLMAFTYHPIPFPGFERIKCHRSEVELRLKAILTKLDIAKGDWILDIGANVGFFSFSLERLGALVEAYELNSATFEIGAALSKLHKTNVLYVNKPLGLESLQYLRPHYKAVLLLSVFHWIVKQEGREGAAVVLRSLSRHADMIFFEVPTSSSDGMFQDELFASKASIESFLRETLPGVPYHELVCDEGWGGRFLLCIDCKGARAGA